MKTYLITGGAGFIGSNFIHYMAAKYANQIQLVNVDKLTYAGNRFNLLSLEDHANYHFFQTDINNREEIAEIFQRFEPDIVVNFAAETHVDRSINNPGIFITANVQGTQCLLDHALKYPVQLFVQISTDEVYGSLETGSAKEDSVLDPSSPYSASKAAADLLARAYYKTYRVPVVISRCTNNYGPRQFPEKLIPLIIKQCLNNEPIPLYGDGRNIRDWLFVDDHCQAIDLIASNARAGEIYNIGGGISLENREIINLVISAVRDSLPADKRSLLHSGLIQNVTDRPGHDRRYAVNSEKIAAELQWKPGIGIDEGIKATVDWYLNNRWIMEN